MTHELFLNGISADDGSYITSGITSEMIARIARKQTFDVNLLKDIKLRKARDLLNPNKFGVIEGVDSTDLSQTGWCVVFPASYSQKSVDVLREALKPLLDLRKAQSTLIYENYYKEIFGIEGYRQGETKNDFLKRFGRGPGAADPGKFPYYVLIVGDPEVIPFTFQYQLDIQYAVGRIHFEKPEDYYRYATSVVKAETVKLIHSKNVVFFGVANPNDPATAMSSQHLINPLVEKTKKNYREWDVNIISPNEATKTNLSNYLGGEYTPSLFFSASHGMGFRSDDPRQISHQGALLCQDWPGPKAHRPITEKYYFSSDDIASDANVFGMIALFFACYGGGTPKVDNFYHQAFGTPKDIAPYSFIAQLPLKLLSHPKGGALAILAHVERAWTTSIIWDQTVRDIETFYSTVNALLNGKPAGCATEYFNSRYAEITSDLTEELEKPNPTIQDEIKIAGLWISNNDARNYTLIGDPAVRLNVNGSA